jgi:molecular chaperone GrpE
LSDSPIRPDDVSGEPEGDSSDQTDTVAASLEGEPTDGAPVDAVDDEQGGDRGDADVDAHADAIELSVESLLDDLERVTKERDGYLDDTRRVAAEFANFRRQTERRYTEIREQAAASLAEQLLPVLDACDAALMHGATDVEPIHNMLITTLEKAGLTVLRPLGDSFDPNLHEAVMHEQGDGDGPHVAEVLRTGYVWNGRVLRPALVKVRD